MRVDGVLAQATTRLRSEGVESPQFDAELLLAHVLGVNRAAVLTWPDRQLTPKQVTLYRHLVGRRSAREPLAYIVGHREFFGLDLVVNPDVLIPRPETELLVERALHLARQWVAPSIADVGSGSGAIAVALAANLPQATLYALDESPGALAVTAQNTRQHNMSERVHCLQGDLLEPLSGPVHLITANLPYVTTDEWGDLPPEIRQYEPRSALDGGPDGLVYIRRLLACAEPYLQPHGALLLEIGASQGRAVSTLARWHIRRSNVQLYQDYAGLDRLLVVHT
jgi:release factor glutamine methyltransferase